MTTGVLTIGAGPILIGVTVTGTTAAYTIHGDGTDGTAGATEALVGTTGAGVVLVGITGVGAEPLPGIMDGAGTTMVGEAIMAIHITATTDMDVVIITTATTIPEGAITTEIH
jgi:hypothetical protein